MLNVSASSGSSTVALQKAILIYGLPDLQSWSTYGDAAMAHATVNDIDMSSGKPVIKAGRLVTQSDLQTLAAGLAQSQALTAPAWIDTTMLALGAGRMVWYSPPSKTALFFKKSGLAQNLSFDGQGSAAIPGLVWMVLSHQLYVFAFTGKGRPTQETKLYQAPFFNVWSRGKVCAGSAGMPKGDDAGLAQKWMTAFFGSHFTHVNFTEKDRLVKGECPVAFWQSMLAKPRKSFPERVLVELPLSVGDLVSSGVEQVLGRIPKAKGEF
jgi:PRTRC genetic system protein B